MSELKKKQIRALKRKIRTRSKIFGTNVKPRLSVYRSNKHIYIQAIDDENMVTLVAFSDIAKDLKAEGTKTEKAIKVAEEFAKLLKKKGIKTGVFDRGQYKYHGRVKAIAETLRKNGIKI